MSRESIGIIYLIFVAVICEELCVHDVYGMNSPSEFLVSKAFSVDMAPLAALG
jgi:hypothetical protein